MKFSTLAVLAAAVAFPATALAQSSGGSTPGNIAPGAAPSSTGPTNPNTTQSGLQNGDSGMPAPPASSSSDPASDMGGTGDANTGRRTTTTPNTGGTAPNRQPPL